MKKILLVGGAIIVLFIVFNVKNADIQEEATIVAKHVEEFGSSWYVDEHRLDKSFKNGFWNPKTGDNIDLKIDSEGRIVVWEVKR